MKTHLLFIFSFLLFPFIAHAQQGNTRSYPIEVGTYNSEFDYSDSQNTEDFTNNYTGRPSNDVKKAFTYCYADAYTGIDTLINTDGYYNRRTFFYKNGLVVEGYYPERDHLELQKLKEFSEERFTSMYFIGIYRIYGDTLKIQYIRETQSLNDAGSGIEKWYKIIDKNTMLCINDFNNTTIKRERELSKSYPSDIGDTLRFVPVSVKIPQPDDNLLKRKWFWCNEQDWENYMKHLKQAK